LEDKTGVPELALFGLDLGEYCIAERISWFGEGKTTRVEDEAYCLLGIFNVHISLIYGEGRRVFYRLHEEIISILIIIHSSFGQITVSGTGGIQSSAKV